jgi:hypothetical protein
LLRRRWCCGYTTTAIVVVEAGVARVFMVPSAEEGRAVPVLIGALQQRLLVVP